MDSDSWAVDFMVADRRKACLCHGSDTGPLKYAFHFSVEIPRNLLSLGVSVWSEVAGQLVIGQVYAVGPLVDQDSDWCIRSCVRHKPSHRLHDQRIANDQSNAFGVPTHACLREHRSGIKPKELHQTDLTFRVLNQHLHLFVCLGGTETTSELAHIGLADCGFHGPHNAFEWLRGSDAPSLTADLPSCSAHLFPLSLALMISPAATTWLVHSTVFAAT